MRALLMHRDRDFDLKQGWAWGETALMQDLELDTLLDAMAAGDEFLLDVAWKALLSGLRNDMDTIVYRQAIVKDCLKNPALIRQLYALTVTMIDRAKKEWWGISSHYPSSMLYSSLDLLGASLGVLKKLRAIAEDVAGQFESEGFITLFATLRNELGDEYLARIQEHLKELRFRRGALLSAELGESNEGTKYMLCQSREKEPNWLTRFLGNGPPSYAFGIAERDETGARILSEIRHRGISRVAIAVAESADHVLNFFKMLRTELAFYVACLNLHDRLAAKKEPVCFPTPMPAGERRMNFSGFYDVCLSLRMKDRVVGNSADVNGKDLIIITGANQGGKSSFLRGVGLAQLMMQCGMFVGAEAFEAELCRALFSHYKRGEDATMKSGKFDEELSRMSEIAERITRNSTVLFNESFAATNEREGSEIAKQIVRALLEKGVRIFYVTHLYEFARGFFDRAGEGALFLRAERRADGTRTFRLLEGEPLETGYGEDLYRQIFKENEQSQGREVDGLISANAD